MISKELLKGTLKTIVLRLLESRGKMYGYEITQHVKELSKGTMILTEGALYPTLHKLEADGLVTIEKVSVGNRVRKYYLLTTKGTHTATDKVQEFHAFVKAMQLILHPKTS